jgi:hypothetical protein
VTVAFDAATTKGDSIDVTFSHTPVGTPRGVLFFCVHTLAVDQVVSVSYGGVAMSEVSNSPFLAVAGANPRTAEVYFLGSGIPVGVQNVIVDRGGTAGGRLIVVTLTGASDTTIDAVATLDTVIQDPTKDINTTASTNTWIMGALGFQGIDTSTVGTGAGYTQISENDIGTWQVNSQYRTANGTGGTIACPWTTTLSADCCAFVVAVKDSGGGGGGTGPDLDPMGMSGFFGG